MPLPRPRDGYRRLDIRPSPRLQVAMGIWIDRQERGIPLAAAARTLIWLGLQAAGVEPVRASKRVSRVVPVLSAITGEEIG